MRPLTESELIEKLCRTFNTQFSFSRNAMQALAETIDHLQGLHPGLRNLNGREFISLFENRMNVWRPTDVRELVIDILTHLMKDKVTTDSSKKELDEEINNHLIPIQFW